MRILEARDGFIKFESKTKVALSSFIQIKGAAKQYIAQVVKTARPDDYVICLAKILFLYDGSLKNYDKTLPDRSAEISEFTLDILNKSFQHKTPVIAGRFIEGNINILIDKDCFNKKMLISSDNPKNNNTIISNFAKQFAAYSNVLIIDMQGVINSPKFTAGKDFKLPLNTDSLEFIYEDCLNDATIESKSLIKEIFQELSDYSKTVRFLPFGALKTIVDEMVDTAHIFKLLVLKNKLAKFGKLGYFASSSEELENLFRILKSKSAVIDLSKLDTLFQNRYLSVIYSILAKQKIKPLVFIEASNALNKKNIRTILTADSVPAVFAVHSKFKYINEIKDMFDNYIIEPSFTNNEVFKTYKMLLGSMPKDTCLITGKGTNNIPLISFIEDMEFEIPESKPETAPEPEIKQPQEPVKNENGLDNTSENEEIIKDSESPAIEKKTYGLINRIAEEIGSSKMPVGLNLFDDTKENDKEIDDDSTVPETKEDDGNTNIDEDADDDSLLEIIEIEDEEDTETGEETEPVAEIEADKKTLIETAESDSEILDKELLSGQAEIGEALEDIPEVEEVETNEEHTDDGINETLEGLDNLEESDSGANIEDSLLVEEAEDEKILDDIVLEEIPEEKPEANPVYKQSPDLMSADETAGTDWESPEEPDEAEVNEDIMHPDNREITELAEDITNFTGEITDDKYSDEIRNSISARMEIDAESIKLREYSEEKDELETPSDVIPLNDGEGDDELFEIAELNDGENPEADILVEIDDSEEYGKDSLDEEIVKDVDKVFTTIKDDSISDEDLDFIDELNSEEAESEQIPKQEQNKDTSGTDESRLLEQNEDTEAIPKGIEELDSYPEEVEEYGILEPVREAATVKNEDKEILETRTSSTTIVPVYDAEIPQEDMVISDPIEQGDTVLHAKYGTGVVEKMIKYGTKTLYSINFDNIGRRLLDPALTEIKKS